MAFPRGCRHQYKANASNRGVVTDLLVEGRRFDHIPHLTAQRRLCAGKEQRKKKVTTGNLDIKNAETVFDIFKRLAEEFNQTLLIVTHDLDFAGRTHHITEMEDGKLI